MIKNNKTLKAVILTAIFTTIIVGGLGVTAVTLTAKNVIFNSTSENLKATNVEDAINELYVLGNDKLSESYDEGYNAGYGSKELVIPSILHNRNGEKGNNYIAATKVTLDVKGYNTLTIGSVAVGAGYTYSVKADGVSINATGTTDITNYDEITFTISEIWSGNPGAGDHGFYNIKLS